jgi:putative membrane protein
MLEKSSALSLVIILLSLSMILSDLIGLFFTNTSWFFHLSAILLIPLLASYAMIVFNENFLIKAFLVFFFGGLIIEILGTRTGIPFGVYEYTSKFQPQILNIPIQIPLGWFTLGIMCYTIAYFSQKNTLKRILLASALMVSWDILYDPIFTAYKVWIWQGGEYFNIPITNFVGWFLSSIIFFSIIEFTSDHTNNDNNLIVKLAPLLIYIAYMVDGGLQNIILNQLLAAILGTTFMLINTLIVINYIRSSSHS